MDSITRLLSYERDKDGNRIKLSWDSDGLHATFDYDGLDRMAHIYNIATMTNVLETFVYNSRGL